MDAFIIFRFYCASRFNSDGFIRIFGQRLRASFSAATHAFIAQLKKCYRGFFHMSGMCLFCLLYFFYLVNQSSTSATHINGDCRQQSRRITQYSGAIRFALIAYAIKE